MGCCWVATHLGLHSFLGVRIFRLVGQSPEHLVQERKHVQRAAAQPLASTSEVKSPRLLHGLKKGSPRRTRLNRLSQPKKKRP